MRQRFIGILATSTLLAIGGAAFALQAANYHNVPGPITGSYADGIKGSFRFQGVSAPNGIPSSPSGGACIIFRAKDLGFKVMSKKHCTSDSQCPTPGESAGGYCHQPTNKCWSRPDPTTAPGSDAALCRRGVAGPAGADIEISATPAAISTPTWKISKNAKARVLTCLNGLPPGGCAGNGNAYAYEWGKPKQL
ncbi:MAG: hypothetical protein ACJ8E4_00970 [Sphingomicrobium sp.]